MAVRAAATEFDVRDIYITGKVGFRHQLPVRTRAARNV